MLRRYLSTSVKRISCGNCVFYNNANGLCKFNKLPALDNRINDSICGKEAKQFWELDRTFQHKHNVSFVLTMVSLFTFTWGLFIQGHSVIGMIGGFSTLYNMVMTEVYYYKYISDNYMFEEKKTENKKQDN